MKFTRHLKIITLCTMIFGALLSCSFLTNGPVEPELTPEYFPNQVGNRWTYSVPIEADTATGQPAGVATFVIAIVDSTEVLNGMPVSIWVRTQPDSKVCPECEDTTFVFTDETFVRFIEWVEVTENSRELRIVSEFRVPFRADETWDWNPFTDGKEAPDFGPSGTTVRTTSIQIGVGEFERAHLISIDPNSILTIGERKPISYYWFVPHIGIVSFLEKTNRNGVYSTPEEYLDILPDTITNFATLGPPDFTFRSLSNRCSSIFDVNENGFLDEGDLLSCAFFSSTSGPRESIGNPPLGSRCDTLFDRNGNGIFDEEDALGCSIFKSPYYYDIEDSFLDIHFQTLSLPVMWELQDISLVEVK